MRSVSIGNKRVKQENGASQSDSTGVMQMKYVIREISHARIKLLIRPSYLSNVAHISLNTLLERTLQTLLLILDFVGMIYMCFQEWPI